MYEHIIRIPSNVQKDVTVKQWKTMVNYRHHKYTEYNNWWVMGSSYVLVVNYSYLTTFR